MNKNNKEIASFIENGKSKFNKNEVIKNNNVPFANALLSSNIFGIKKVIYRDYNDLEDFGEYGKSRYYNVIPYKVKEEKNGDNYLNYSIFVRSTRPLCQKAFKMLMAVLYLSQTKHHNEKGQFEFHITEIFNIFNIDNNSRTPKLRRELCSQINALSAINMKFKVINSHTKMKPEDFDSYNGDIDYETGDFSLFNITNMGDYVLKVSINEHFTNMHSFSHWKTIDLDEYNLLTTDTEKSFFRFINTKDFGGDSYGECHYHTKLEKFYNEVRLNDYTVKKANEKIKITLASLKEKGFIKDYKFNTPSKTLDITFITKKERVMKGLEGMNKTARDRNQYIDKKQRKLADHMKEVKESMKYLM